MTRAAQALGIVAALAAAAPARARTPPIVNDPREGVWIGAGERFIYQTIDHWDVYPAPATVNRLAVDGATLWIATDDGVVRFDTGSRKSTRLGMDDGLPSEAVASVAVDDKYVWFATNKGLARYRKLDRTVRVYTDVDGLPSRAVNDALVLGQKVWLATRGGLAVYDPDVDGLRAYTARDGLAGEEILELYQVGDDLWCRTDVGLSRFRVRAHAFTNFRDLAGGAIRAVTLDGDKLWVGTDKGLFGLETASDAVVPFPQQAALAAGAVIGIETFTDYLYLTTETEVVQYYKVTGAIRRYTEADGLKRRAGATGTLLVGGLYTVLFPDGAESYNVGRDLWVERGLAATETGQSDVGVRFFGRMNAFMPFDLETGQLGEERYATAEAGFGLGLRFGGGRSLDASLNMDYGQLEPLDHFQYRDLTYRLEYEGAPTDFLREVLGGDKLPYRTLEEGLERSLLLEGGQVRLATGAKGTGTTITVAGGRRRGGVQRDFLAGPRQAIYALSQKYVLPGTEKVLVDGELMTNGTDYSVIYPAGQLAFLDPERVDDLSVIEVEYEYDLDPKKGLGVLSILDLLPADREVGDWVRAGEARLIREESGLYQQIDGNAPKYIDRGWVRSVYAEFRQGSRTIAVAIHDMGGEANAETIYTFDLPQAREPVPGREELVIDVGLPAAYAVKGRIGAYYTELSIDEKSDTAKQSLTLFAIQMRDRATTSGENPAGQVREYLASVRVAHAPAEGVELGARAVESYGVGPDVAGQAPRRLLAGVVDGRIERPAGDRGNFTAYAELAGTKGQNPGDPTGWAALARLRLSSPYLEGTLLGRHESAGYTALGSDASWFGKLEDEVRFSTTAYVAPWLPTSAFFLRQQAANGVLQQALARVHLAREDLPGISLQVGHTLLDGPAEDTGRVRFVGQLDYDLARALGFLHLKYFTVRGLYGLAQARTDDVAGAFAHADRVQLLRLEAKLAPTATESAWLLFRDRQVWQQAVDGGSFDLGLRHYELYAGARSAIVPGLIPLASYSALYDELHPVDAFAGRSLKGSFTGALGIYPGQWWAALAPMVIEPRYSVSEDSQTEEDLQKVLERVYRLDNRAVWTGTVLALELLQLYQESRSAEDQHEDERRLELRNRIVYRPVPSSPITLRVNHLEEWTLNDQAVLPGAPAWGEQTNDELVLEWLRRWSAVVTSQIRASGVRATTTDLLKAAALPLPSSVQTFVQDRLGLELELRLFPLDDAARLYILQRDGVFWLSGDGAGAVERVDFYAGAGAIWVAGAKAYLDVDVLYRRLTCLAQPCTPAQPLEARLYLTFNL